MSEDREMSDKSYDGEEHFDKYDHYNYDQDKAMMSGHSGEWEMYVSQYVDDCLAGKQRSKKEAEMNTNRHNPGGHERKIATKLINMEKNLKSSECAKNKA